MKNLDDFYFAIELLKSAAENDLLNPPKPVQAISIIMAKSPKVATFITLTRIPTITIFQIWNV